MKDLFDAGLDETLKAQAPLADRMRPRTLDELVGQIHVVGKDSMLRQAIDQDRLFSIILWGPPGCGKTTIAGIIARETRSFFVELSAVLSGVADIRRVIKAADDQRRLHGRRTIVFVDEIHRFNKSQQDAFLPHVEKGRIVLVGATTENPSFEVIPALVSRCRVLSLNALDAQEVLSVLRRALSDTDRGLGKLDVSFTDDALAWIARSADGDVRIALTCLETTAAHAAGRGPWKEGEPSDEGAPAQTAAAVETPHQQVTAADVEAALQARVLRYDKTGDEHFNLISAFHKSLRGSDPDAALYWMARMLRGGEDPFYILRRMVRFAVEDVGIADPGALTTALNALEAFRFLGHPEGDDAMAQAAVYLATAPKSNRVYMAGKSVRETVEKTGSLAVPLHIRNAPTGLMKELGYGRGYRYAHDYKDGYVPQSYLPAEISEKRFYTPTDRGYEQTVKRRLDGWLATRNPRKSKGGA